MKKQFPARYATNAEAVGIELVGRAELPPGYKLPANATQADINRARAEDGIFETPTAAQNQSLKWLIDELVDSLKVDTSQIYRHPVVSWKNPDEARRAQW
jgi:hypothetical protein